MSKKVVGKLKLSFDVDEEEEDGGDFQVKKSKESRKFKKMRQAPGIAEAVVEAVPEKTVAQELGGSYSAENLAKLRQAQLFVAAEDQPSVKKTESQFEEIELSGEAAEEFVEMAERQAMQQNQNLGEYVAFDKSADLEAIHAGRLSNKALLKGAPDRVYTSELINPKKAVAFDLAQDNDSEWEEEIIRRGVINKTTALSAENKEVTERASRMPAQHRGADSTGTTGNGVDSSVFGEITVTDLMRSVQLAVDKLSANEAAARRKIEQNATEVGQARVEERELREKVEVGVRKLNTVQVMPLLCVSCGCARTLRHCFMFNVTYAQEIKFFFASLVGMLRDKSGSLKELGDAVAACAKERYELMQLGRVEEQEDIVYRLKEVSAGCPPQAPQAKHIRFKCCMSGESDGIAGELHAHRHPGRCSAATLRLRTADGRIWSWKT
jgi:hypothetical protein